MKKNTIYIYIVELIIGVILIYIDFKYFLIWFFMMMLIIQHKNVEYLRKMMRVFQTANEVKIMAIIKKLNISKEEIDEIIEVNKKKVSKEGWESLEEDIADITKKI